MHVQLFEEENIILKAPYLNMNEQWPLKGMTNNESLGLE